MTRWSIIRFVSLLHYHRLPIHLCQSQVRYRNIHRTRDRHTDDGKALQNPRHDGRLEPGCPRNGCGNPRSLPLTNPYLLVPRRIPVPYAKLQVFSFVFARPSYSSFNTHTDIVGDKICIFGFSRGAYTARALAGMVHKVRGILPVDLFSQVLCSRVPHQVGLLPACNHQQVPFAYKMFSREDETGWSQSNAFKKAFCVDVDIEFIGVWCAVPLYIFPSNILNRA